MSALLLADLALEADPDLPAFFLGQLASLVARQVASASPTEREALSAAAFAIFLDCLDLGLGNEARALIEQLRDRPVVPVRLAA